MTMPQRVSRRTITAVIAVAAAAALAPAGWSSAFAQSDRSAGTIRLVVVESGTYPSAGDDPETFYGLFSLEGACGFDRARIALQYTESFFVALHQGGTRAGGYNGLGRIDDEAFTLEVLDADGNVLQTYTGTADEHATAVGITSDDGQALQHSNYSFLATGSSGDGSTIRLAVKGRYRTDPQTGELRRFDYGIKSCRVD